MSNGSRSTQRKEEKKRTLKPPSIEDHFDQEVPPKNPLRGKISQRVSEDFWKEKEKEEGRQTHGTKYIETPFAVKRDRSLTQAASPQVSPAKVETKTFPL